MDRRSHAETTQPYFDAALFFLERLRAVMAWSELSSPQAALWEGEVRDPMLPFHW